jgi:hypothetical protein
MMRSLPVVFGLFATVSLLMDTGFPNAVLGFGLAA